MSARADRVLLCVSGGIAAYKAPEIVRAFVAAGIEVRVVTTPAALAFTTEMSLATPGQVDLPFVGEVPLPQVQIETPVILDPEWNRPAE